MASFYPKSQYSYLFNSRCDQNLTQGRFYIDAHHRKQVARGVTAKIA